MRLLCEWGVHSFRFVAIRYVRLPMVFGHDPHSWEYTRKCKRCRLTHTKTVYKYPKWIRTAVGAL